MPKIQMQELVKSVAGKCYTALINLKLLIYLHSELKYLEYSPK